MEKTLLIIKPDAFSKKVAGGVISRLEKEGYRMAAAKMMWFSKDTANRFYCEHKGKVFYDPLIEFMCSNPVMVMVWEGKSIISGARKLMGATDPAKAETGTIRKDWAANGRHNIIHGSDSKESAEREIKFFFPESADIYSWQEKVYKL